MDAAEKPNIPLAIKRKKHGLRGFSSRESFTIIFLATSSSHQCLTPLVLQRTQPLNLQSGSWLQENARWGRRQAASSVEVTSLHVSTQSWGASRGAEDQTGVEFHLDWSCDDWLFSMLIDLLSTFSEYWFTDWCIRYKKMVKKCQCRPI